MQLEERKEVYGSITLSIFAVQKVCYMSQLSFFDANPHLKRFYKDFYNISYVKEVFSSPQRGQAVLGPVA